MRLENSLKNLKFNMLSHILNIIIQFITRTIFIHTLGTTYLGINGLLTNVLTVLSLADLGIGSVLTFTMYEPLAKKDEKKLSQLINEYRKIYNYIALFVLIVGLALIPLLPIFIKESSDINNLQFIYLLYLLNTVISYLCIYKTSIITADQKEYIVKIYQQIVNLIANISMIIVLLLFKNFIIYLLIKMFFSILSNFIVSKKAEKMYPAINEKNVERLSEKERKSIYSNAFAMMFHKIGGVIVSGTDNILISSMISLKSVGVYSNYSMVVSAIKGFSNQIFMSITASVGNLNVVSGKEHSYSIFKKTFFINFWVYGFCTITLFSLFNPFIELWLGVEYKFNDFTVFLIVMTFFVDGMRLAVQIFRDAYGIFKQDKIKPLIEAILNLIISIICTLKFGICGIFVGTIFSMLLSCTFEEPYFLFKYGFSNLKELKKYYILIIKYYLITLLMISITFIISQYIVTTFISFIIKALSTVIITNLAFYVMFRNSEEFKYFLNLLNSKIKKRVRQ